MFCLQYSVLELDDGGVLTVATKWIDETGKCYYPKQVKGQNPKRMVLALQDLPVTIDDNKWHTYENVKTLHQYGKFSPSFFTFWLSLAPYVGKNNGCSALPLMETDRTVKLTRGIGSV